jgi:hypothetical protein
MQDLLFLAHPDARGPFVGASRRRKVAMFAAEIAGLPAPRGMADLVARHSMLHHLFDLGRDDVRVSFWAGRREFHGSEPPGRLLKWPELRRVREERWRVGLIAEAVGDPQARAIITSLIAASPLTDLLEPTRLEPRWDLKPLARWLRLPEVARAVADRYLATGLSQIGPAFVTALLELYNRKECVAESRTATAFVCHLQLLSLLAEAALPEATRRIRLETAIQQQEALRDFYGLFAAAQRVGLGRPADLKRDRRLAALVDSQARLCHAACGESRVHELTGVLTRGVGDLALAS